MAEKVADLGAGLELWRAEVDELKEQDLNARTMPKAMFDRLAKTIGEDNRLESLPFAAKTERGLEVVSGHHRVRAARAAKVSPVFVLVDVTDLDHSKIAAKQLAHNAIQGEDDQEVLARIYQSIDDVNARLESFIDPAQIAAIVARTPVPPIAITIDYQTALITFLPTEEARFAAALERTASMLTQKADKLYLADLERLDQFKGVIRRIGRDYDVRSLGTIFSVLAELALSALGEPIEEPAGYAPLVEVFGAATIPVAAAERIRLAIAKTAADTKLKEKERWHVLETWAEAVLT